MPQVSLAPPSLYLSFLSAVGHFLPSLPPTVRDVDVPPAFRRRFIWSGYRPVGLSRRSYVLSLFQLHNETLSVWSHLLAGGVVAARFVIFTIFSAGGLLGVRLQGPEDEGVSVDVVSLPLVLYVLSAIMYLSCSAAAHLLHPQSERAHYALFFLDYAVMSVHQYGSALALHLYSSAPPWPHSIVGQMFLPSSALLSWLCCASRCYAELCSQRLHQGALQVLPVGAAHLLLLSLLAHRLVLWSCGGSYALPLHVLQVALLLSAFFFFCFPIPECFSPGGYDLLGHAHQLFHLLQALCTLVQQEALYRDFTWRRPALLRESGEQRLLLACVSFPFLGLCCLATVFVMVGRAEGWREEKERR